MIHLSTGTPGSGKTLNLLDLVEKEAADRPIYYRGIKDLTLPWQQLTDEEVHQWHTFPPGSVFVIDEVQQIWPKIPHTRKSPESVERLDTHRHGGYDFYIVTQASRLLDSAVQSFIDRHYHYQRSSGLSYTKRFEWEEFCKDVSSTIARKDAQISRIPFNKKTFSKYKSAEVHTGKVRIPKPLIVALVLVIALSGLVYNFLGRHNDDPVIDLPVGTISETQVFDDEMIDIATPENDISKWIPRIPQVPWSAPAYDGVTQVKTYPRPQCIRNDRTKVCKCFTQQATVLDIGESSCNEIVKNGWFDPFKDESIAPQATQEQGARLDEDSTEPTDLQLPIQQQVAANPVRRVVGSKNQTQGNWRLANHPDLNRSP